ncbi:FMN-binding protein [Verrucomicrobia bacterium S94]|nr:FMN-binding protein [Verrucomicrobia bacterium S94]
MKSCSNLNISSSGTETMTTLIRPTWLWAMSFKATFLSCILLAASVQAGKYPTADEAVRQIFPKAVSFGRETRLLTQTQQQAVADLSAQKDITALVTRYAVYSESGTLGYAYLDKHMVRTLPETLMVAVDTDRKLVGIRVLAFREPAEYIARDGWLEQFLGKTVKDEIRMKKNIDGITGATLTSRAVTQCARRTLAIHQVLEQQD